MLSRRFQYGTNSIIIALIVLGILAVVNFMSTRHFVRADLTEGKDFTISPSTRKVLRELDDIVNIEAYFSKELPPYLVGLERRVRDIFDEYRAYAQGNLSVKFTDPASDPQLEQKMRFIGIPQAQVNIVEKDKSEVVNIYFGVAISYEDKKEVIPVIQNVMTLEYDLTSAIVKVKRSEAKTLGFLTGHGEYTAEQDYEGIRTSLAKQYSIVDVDLSGEKKIPPTINTLIVGGPKEKISERDKYEIDQYLMRGGRIIFLVDPVNMDESRGLSATANDTGLGDLLENYGVQIGQSLVLDGSSRANAAFSSGYVQYRVPYPYWPRVTRRQFSKDSPMVNQLESLVLTWASPVELIESKVSVSSEDGAGDTGKLSGVVLCNSSQYSWTKGQPYNLNPQQRATGDLKIVPLAVAVSGKFDSFYTEKPALAPDESDEADPEAPPVPEEVESATILESPETQIVVVGNASFITNKFLSMFGSNQIFLENAVDWLTLGEDLISIRSRFVTNRPLKEISEGTKLFIRIINICGASILVIAFGLARFVFKRRAKKVFETYSSLGGN